MNSSRGVVRRQEMKNQGKLNSDEFRHQQIYSKLLTEFHNDIQTKTVIEKAKKERDIESARENAVIPQQVVNKEPGQNEIIMLRNIYRKKEFELSYSDRQFIELFSEKYPDLELKEERAKEKREKDSLNNLTKGKDSISTNKSRDSLNLKRAKDSLAEISIKKLKKVEKDRLINPVSDN